jgi:signal peptidase II
LKLKKFFLLGIVIATIVAILDLLSKRAIFAILEQQQVFNPEIKLFDFLSLVYVWNRGVSFGMFNSLENSQLIFSIIQGSIALGLCFWLWYAQKKHITISLGLIIGGAFGNVIDRIQNGAVADFIDFHVGIYHWPAFNLADSCVFVGVTILLFDEILFKEKK